MLRNTIIQQVYSEAVDSGWKEPFIFIQGADTQLGMIEKYQEKKDNPRWDKELDLTRQAILAANEMQPKPKFFIVCGDLVNDYPEEVDHSEQVRDFLTAFKELNNDIPLVCVCGNHDVGDTPTVDGIQNFRANYGRDYFTFQVSGCLMIVLNSQYYADPSKVLELAEEQDIWLDEVLEDAKTKAFKHVIVFQHIPWFLKTPEEDDAWTGYGSSYYNLSKKIRGKMLEKLHDGGVRHVFCGHYHRNAGGSYKEMEVVVTSAIGAQLGNDVSGLRVVRVYEDTVRHTYYGLSEIPQIIVL
ncbi:Serine/threonine-protein phosphatase CPPED1 [Halotydeus destructor]|nr:Serine/threonine-protein phosphatase CPPED1 [Halotydeus destructor]